MNDQRSYGILAPGASRLKRKDRESLHPAKRSHMAPPPPQNAASTTMKSSKGTSTNKLLAGYMAYEFLTKGTLLGQKFDGGRAESGTEAEPVKPWKDNNKDTYKEITSLLMMNNDEGVHIAGIVNPTQLARWIQM